MRPEFGEHSLSQNLVVGHFAGDRGDEPWQDKVSREASLFKAGWSAAEETAKDSVSDSQIASTALQVLASVGAGVVMAKLAPARGIVGFAGKSLSIGMATSFVSEVATHARAIAGAASDTWATAENQRTNTEIVEGHLGRFLFDTALGTAGGAAGMKLGKGIFQTGNARPLSALIEEPLAAKPLAAKPLDVKPLSAESLVSNNSFGVFEIGRGLSPQTQLAYDTVFPPQTRVALAQRSRMYAPDRAFTFAIALEEAVPGIEARIQTGLKQVKAAQREFFFQEYVKDGGSITHRGKTYYRSADFMNQHYSKVIPEHPAVKAFYQDLKAIEIAVNPIITEAAHQAGFPAPRLSFTLNLPSRGYWEKGLNKLTINAERLTQHGDFAKTSYHELTHAEQTNLVARRIADELRLPAASTAEDQDLLYRAFKNCFNLNQIYGQKSGRDLKRYISESLRLREGKPLKSAQEARAIELIESFKGVAFKNRTDKYYSAMNSYLETSKLTPQAKTHLLYRGSIHEIEAWETAGLVPALKIKRN